MSTVPYVYFIGWTKLKKYYYGVQYRNGCNPKNLFTTYFTSSKSVNSIIEEFGLPDIVEVRKTFKQKHDALLHEHKVLRRLNVKNREDFLNKTNGRDWKQTSDGLTWIRNHNDPQKATEVKYIKNKDEIPNGWVIGFKAQSDYQKQKASEWSSNHRHSKETLKVMSEAQKGNKNHRYGKKATQEHIKKLKDSSLKGKENPMFSGMWVLPHGEFFTQNEAVKFSPFKVGTDTLRKWCKSKNDTRISKGVYSQSFYLKNMFKEEDCVGKTFKEIGFGFLDCV